MTHVDSTAAAAITPLSLPSFSFVLPHPHPPTPAFFADTMVCRVPLVRHHSMAKPTAPIYPLLDIVAGLCTAVRV